MSAEVKTTCAYCGVGCGVIATPGAEGAVKIRGDKAHPANFGRLCSKGTALGDTVSLDGRLLAPIVDGRPAPWDVALDAVADRFAQTIAEHGPDSVAFYVSGQLLTEDYYVANKLMKGYIGSANIDTNSRLCMASTVAGHRRAFGTDTVPGRYEDLEEADLVVLVGSNLAWCHPVLYQRLVAAKKARPGMKVVNIDPRRTATCDIADMHLAIAPGADVALFNGLLSQIAARGAEDRDFLAHVDGYEDAVAAALGTDLSVTGLAPADIAAFIEMWIDTPRVVTVFSQGVNQSSAGADKVNAILNCHLATGRIGTPGCGPFSVTGQPNAMGGREVGGLANMLACHLDIEDAAHRDAVQGFWSSPAMPERAGAKAVDMFDKVASGEIRAIWIICTNPVVSLPDADRVRAALEACPTVVVSDLFATTDTARLADIVLPATGWGEKDGTVTNSERCISRQRAFLPVPGQARHDWDILADVGRRMGWEAAFAYDGPAQIFREHAALSGIAADLGRDFDISALAGLDDAAYDALPPTYWPVGRADARFFADGAFFTQGGRGRMLPLAHRAPASRTGPRFPYRLNTGRVRDQWHTMTRTARAPQLNAHLPEPFLEVHPEDARALGLDPAGLVRVTSPRGAAILRVSASDAMRRGEVFAPMHWTGEEASAGRIGALVAPEVDPVSGQPESKASVVALAPFEATWHGFLVTRDAVAPATDYWVRARMRGGWRYEMAGAAPLPEDLRAWFCALLGVDCDAAEVMQMSDRARGLARLALIEDGRLVAALYLAPRPLDIARSWLMTRLGEDEPNVLAGRPGADMPDPGPMLCACMGVGVNTILAAIRTDRIVTVEAIGAALGAGTNCGSCKSEIAQMIDAELRLADAG